MTPSPVLLCMYRRNRSPVHRPSIPLAGVLRGFPFCAPSFADRDQLQPLFLLDPRYYQSFDGRRRKRSPRKRNGPARSRSSIHISILRSRGGERNETISLHNSRARVRARVRCVSRSVNVSFERGRVRARARTHSRNLRVKFGTELCVLDLVRDSPSIDRPS